MTDFWPDDDTENIWRMTDEAWSAYQAWKLSEEGVESPPIAPGPPKGLYPHAAPAIDRERSTRALSAVEELWDFTETCEKCDQPAAHYVQIHWPHVCRHPSMDAGLLHQIVCDTHLALYEVRAQKIVRELNPPAWIRFFRDVKPNCRSCGTAIQTPGDILQIVRPV